MKANNLTMGYVLSDVQSIDCPDNNTAVFNLVTPYSAFLDQISRTPGITISPSTFGRISMIPSITRTAR